MKAGAKKLLNWWKKKVPVTLGTQKHTLTFEGSEKKATLVLRSVPQLPSVFLDEAGKDKGIAAAKRTAPVTTAKTHEKAVKKLQDDLAAYDEGAGKAAAGKDLKAADKLMASLDGRMVSLRDHIADTFTTWGVGDDVVTGVDLPRGSFTLEQKRGIAAQHKKKSDLRFNSKGELVNVDRTAGKELARRHVVSSSDMSRHYMAVLNKKKVSAAKLLLEQRASIGDARVVVKPASVAGIKAAAKERYGIFFGYLRNMFIGDSVANSTIQENLDRGNPQMAGKLTDNHVAHMKRAWALDKSLQISELP